MKRIVYLTVQLIVAGERAYTKKWSFFGLFLFLFVGSIGILGTADLLPETASASAEVVTTTVTPEESLNARAITTSSFVELPIKIEVPIIGLVTTIQNPIVTDVSVLDQELLSGAVRYPTSAKLNEEGNVVLFGHSSYLPVVGNQAYKTFNGIQKLVAGDTITVYAADTAYTYRVKSVMKESAKDNSAIPLSIAGKILTLVTCNSFGAKEDRFVVTADFVESHSISG